MTDIRIVNADTGGPAKLTYDDLADDLRSETSGLLGFDPCASHTFWLADYFPGMFQTAYQIFPPIENVKSMLAQATERTVTDIAFPLPPDLHDIFLAACWRRPEQYLQPEVRAGMSAFVLADKEEVDSGLDRLSKDLKHGAWQRKYGEVLTWSNFDAGYRFIVAA